MHLCSTPHSAHRLREAWSSSVSEALSTLLPGSWFLHTSLYLAEAGAWAAVRLSQARLFRK